MRTTHVGEGRGAARSGRTEEPVPFVSVCPRCTRLQPQRGYSRAALHRLLGAGYPVEAYCVMCDQVWPISAPERAALGRELEV